MRHSFHFTLVKHEGGLDQRFTVSGGAGVNNLHTLRKLFVDIFDSGDGCSQRISVIVVIEGVEECSVFSYQCRFGRCGTGIDTEERLAAVCGQIFYRHLMFRMAGSELFVFCICGKQGIQTLDLDLHLHLAFQFVLEFAQGDHSVFLRIQRRTDSCEQMGMVRRDDVLVIQLQRADESSAELREEVERSSKECHMPADRFSACESADRLVNHRLKDRRGKIFL